MGQEFIADCGVEISGKEKLTNLHRLLYRDRDTCCSNQLRNTIATLVMSYHSNTV
jgi:hypothetical protein